MANNEQISLEGQALGTDGLRATSALADLEALRWIGNLFPFEDEDRRVLQGYAAGIVSRFSVAGWVDMVCALFGWRLVGQGCGADTDANHVERGVNIEWVLPGDDDNFVRLELGDDPTLLVGDREVMLAALPDTLGELRYAARGAV